MEHARSNVLSPARMATARLGVALGIILAGIAFWAGLSANALAFQVQGAIEQKWRELNGAAGPLGDARSDEHNAWNGGKFNEFAFGYIYWHPGTNAHAVYGVIGEKWNALGRERGFGYPLTDEQDAADGGRFNDFAGGGSIYWHRDFGVHAVFGDIRKKWVELARETGPLGYPVSDETMAGDGAGRFNNFQKGMIYWHPNTGVHAVYGEIGKRWKELGGETGSCGFPVSDEYTDLSGSQRSDFQYGSIISSPQGITIQGCHSDQWGLLASPGFGGEPIKTILFFAGEQLNGVSLPQNNCKALPHDITADCRTVWPIDERYLDWTDPQNRLLALQKVVSMGLNTVSMSSWGESTLECTADCSDVSDACCGASTPDCANPVPKCFKANGTKQCRIGWYGSANTQLSPAAKDELFDAALTQPILIIPFIESRFEHDWNFRRDFPTSLEPAVLWQLAPGLISQIEDLIRTYLTAPANPRWPDKWALVYDQHGEARRAVAIVQASSDSLAANDDKGFAEGFDRVAQKIYDDTKVRVGFFIDPVAGDPVFKPGCPGLTSTLHSTYAAAFHPSPEFNRAVAQPAVFNSGHSRLLAGRLDRRCQGRPRTGQ